MNKQSIATNVRQIADLLAISGENHYKVTAYRNAAAALLQSPFGLDEITHKSVSVPGIGPDSLTLIRWCIEGGLKAAMEHLGISIPATSHQLLRVPGIGPKTALTLVHNYHVDSLAALQAALDSNRLLRKPGFTTDKVKRMKRDVAVLIERTCSYPIAQVWPWGMEFKYSLESLQGVDQVSITGDARRLMPMCKRLELIVSVHDQTPFQTWCEANCATRTDDGYEWHMGPSDNPLTVRVYATEPTSFAERQMETTGDQIHNEVIKGLLKQAGYSWTQTGICNDRGSRVSPATEEEIYALVGLPLFPPELRADRGLLQNPATLVQQADIQGDLHVHSNWSDGSLSIPEVVERAESLGYAYIAITDHSQSLSIANGLTPERVIAQKAELERVRSLAKIKLFHGIEVDILADGSLDLPDDILADLDIVIASVHGAMYQSRSQMTNRLVSAIRNPHVDVIGHPTGRIIGRRAGYELDIEAIVEEAARHGVALELNANPNRLDISEDGLRIAAQAGVAIAINTDTHHPNEFANMAYGIRMAHRGWLTKGAILNTLSYTDLSERLKGQ